MAYLFPACCKLPGSPEGARLGQPPRLLLLDSLNGLHGMGHAEFRQSPEKAHKGICPVLQSMLRWSAHAGKLLQVAKTGRAVQCAVWVALVCWPHYRGAC